MGSGNNVLNNPTINRADGNKHPDCITITSYLVEFNPQWFSFFLRLMAKYGRDYESDRMISNKINGNAETNPLIHKLVNSPTW